MFDFYAETPWSDGLTAQCETGGDTMDRTPRIMLIAVMIALSNKCWAESAEVISRVTPEQVAKMLQDSGYRAEMSYTKSGEAFIRSGFAGKKAVISFYQCESNGCGSLQLYTGFGKSDRITQDFANRWNREKRFVKAYIDDDGSSSFEFDIDVAPGISSTYIKKEIGIFETAVGKIDSF